MKTADDLGLVNGELIARDRYTRPLIPDPDTGKPVPYTRVSTLAKALDDKTALMRWKQRMTAVGLAQRNDLLLKVRSTRPDDKTGLDEACEAAMVHAGSDAKANIGTALHALTEQVDAHEELGELDDDSKASLAAYSDLLRQHRIKVEASELFVVNDEIRCAGSFDRLVRWRNRLVILDIKTGQHEPRYPHGTATQISIYANSKGLRPNGQRVPLGDIARDVGLMLWLPSGQAKAELYELDIAAGYDAARLATQARAWFKTKPATLVTPA